MCDWPIVHGIPRWLPALSYTHAEAKALLREGASIVVNAALQTACLQTQQHCAASSCSVMCQSINQCLQSLCTVDIPLGFIAVGHSNVLRQACGQNIGFRCACHAVHGVMSVWLLQGMSMLRRVMATTTGMVMTQR